MGLKDDLKSEMGKIVFSPWTERYGRVVPGDSSLQMGNDAINIEATAEYPTQNFMLRHVVGIDVSELFVAKAGFRGSNDLVWVGRAANHAAKMSSMPESHQTYISSDVYDRLPEELRMASGGQMVWSSLEWKKFEGRWIYRSSSTQSFQ